jgi:hypothetical protein
MASNDPNCLPHQASLLSLTGAFGEDEQGLSGAIERAVQSARAIGLHRLPEAARAVILRRALQTVIKEAIHWARIQFDRKALSERRLVPSDGQDGLAQDGVAATVSMEAAGTAVDLDLPDSIRVIGLDSPRDAYATRSIVNAFGAVVRAMVSASGGVDASAAFESTVASGDGARASRERHEPDTIARCPLALLLSGSDELYYCPRNASDDL